MDDGVIIQEEFDYIKTKSLNDDVNKYTDNQIKSNNYDTIDFLEINVDEEVVAFKLDKKGLTVKHNNNDNEVFIRQQDLIMKLVRETGIEELVISDFVNKKIKYTLKCTNDKVYGVYNKYKEIKGYRYGRDYSSTQNEIVNLKT